MKDIKGYEGLYAVTSCGRIWSYRRKKFLKPSGTKYLHIILCKNGEKKTFLIHRLVAEAYLPNPDNLETIDHIDGNPKNNALPNLQWMTGTDNLRKNQAKKVKCIETGKVFPSIRSAALENKLDFRNLQHSIRYGWKCGNYHWEVIE